MRLSSRLNSRMLFLFVVLVCCVSTTWLQPIGAAPRPSSRSKPNCEFVLGYSPNAAASSPDFTVLIDPSSLLIDYSFGTDPDIDDASATVTLTGTGGFSGDVILSCAVTPITVDEPTCQFSENPVIVDASGSAAAVGLDIGTVGPSCVQEPISAIPGNGGRDAGVLAEIGAGVFILALLSCSLGLVRDRRRCRLVCAVFICAIGLSIAGCGGQTFTDPTCSTGNFDRGTPAGTFMVAITATSGNLTHTLTVPLMVPTAP